MIPEGVLFHGDDEADAREAISAQVFMVDTCPDVWQKAINWNE